jgi:BirA family transcriptional regulator, biotin operon repressor / biotin---[acetyl-CoA-carboxylase] ligase
MQSKILIIEKTASTNAFAAGLLAAGEGINDFFAVCSRIQTEGRGIYKSKWHSEDYKNLTLSIICFPRIDVENNFLISMAVSVAICRYLGDKGVNAQIKWPNDIYVSDKKISGILIENNIAGRKINSSIIGVGININQTDFPPKIPNPVSLKNLIGVDFDVEEELMHICKETKSYLLGLKPENYNIIREEYLSRLFQKGKECRYKTKQGQIIAKIVDVKNDGALILKNDGGDFLSFYFKEIEYILDLKDSYPYLSTK